MGGLHFGFRFAARSNPLLLELIILSPALALYSSERTKDSARHSFPSQLLCLLVRPKATDN